jgi:hypothetical protein
MGKKKRKPKVEKKKVEPPTKIARPNFTQMAVEYRKNESKILLEKVRKLGYLKDRPKPKEEDGEDK